MIFTKRFEIGYKLLKHLEVRKNEVVKLETIAKTQNFDLHFLEQVARLLRTAGYIKSVRGPGGGYTLVNVTVTAFDLIKCLDKGYNKNSPDIYLMTLIESALSNNLIV